MKLKLIFIFSVILLFNKGMSQTFSWSGFPDGGYSYSTGIMDVTITHSSAGFQYGSPKYHADEYVGYPGCGIPGGISLEQRFGNLTSAFVQVELDFSQNNTSPGICADVFFSIMDINAGIFMQYRSFADWVEVSAEDENGDLIPVGNISADIDEFKTIIPSPTAMIVRGTSDDICENRETNHCSVVDFTVTHPTGLKIKKVFIRYHPDYSFDDCDYNSFETSLWASFQYISISEISLINASGPTAMDVDVMHSCSGLFGGITVNAVDGGTAPYVYQLNNQPPTSFPDFPNLPSGNYNVNVTDINGCSYAVDLKIEAYESPTDVDYHLVSGNCSQETGGMLQITSVADGQTPFTYFLDSISVGTSTLGLTSGIHELEVVDAHGCTYSEEIAVDESMVNETLLIPNVFTPNTDNVNNRWFINASCIRSISYSIMNRWGQEVRRCVNSQEYWDGLILGENAVEGVYFYNGEITFWSGETKSISGTITLIR